MPGAEPVVPTAEALRTLAPPGVVVGCRSIDVADLAGLRPAELAAVARAVDARRAEFASGRVLLRELLATDDAIPVRPDRSPQLPAGSVGSLAHDDGLVVAVVAPRRAYTSLGVDIERARPLDVDVALAVRRSDDPPGLDPLVMFTMKEAFYKAWSAAGGAMLEFTDVRLEFEGDHFSAEVVATGDVFAGRFAAAGGRWLALVSVPVAR